MLRLSTARRVADIFWPDFVERDGVILLSYVRPPEPPPGSHPTLTQYERFHGHTHIQELFRWDVPTRYDADLDRPDWDSPEHGAPWELARRIARMWFAKLTTDFPHYRFRVYASRLDDRYPFPPGPRRRTGLGDRRGGRRSSRAWRRFGHRLGQGRSSNGGKLTFVEAAERSQHRGSCQHPVFVDHHREPVWLGARSLTLGVRRMHGAPQVARLSN